MHRAIDKVMKKMGKKMGEKMGIKIAQQTSKHTIFVVKCDVEGRPVGGNRNHWLSQL
jgi:hypothetical protein